MAIYGSSIIYNNVSSEDYGLMLVSFESGHTQNQLGLTREIISDSSAMGQRSIIYGTKYSGVLQYNMTLVKSDGGYFTDMDIREINRWLIGYQYPKKLVIINDDREVFNTYFNCLITDVSQENIGEVAGLTYNITCDAPYAWEDFQEVYDITTANQPIRFYNTSDEIDEYLYPTLKITMTTDGDFTLSNENDLNNTITLTGLLANEEITLDCQNEIIRSTRGTFTSPIGGQDNFSHTWLRLINGFNQLIANGNCRLEIYGKYPRKVGV